jgi:hypothetical protein
MSDVAEILLETKRSEEVDALRTQVGVLTAALRDAEGMQVLFLKEASFLKEQLRDCQAQAAATGDHISEFYF